MDSFHLISLQGVLQMYIKVVLNYFNTITERTNNGVSWGGDRYIKVQFETRSV